jgi:hypothetical protein
MASKTEIANLAISHLGIGKEIANLDTEQTEEASACRRYFDVAKENTLGDLYWNFATRFATLGLVTTTPTEEWGYSYRYPTDCLEVRRILSGIRNDTQRTRIPFKIISDSAGKLIYTDEAEAKIEYTRNISDIDLFSPEFKMALSFRLAYYIAPRLTAGDPFKLKQDMLGLYDIELGLAKKKNMNEETMDQQPESEFIRNRNGGSIYARYEHER